MSVDEATVGAVPVEFTGARQELLGKLLAGYLLMIPTPRDLPLLGDHGQAALLLAEHRHRRRPAGIYRQPAPAADRLPVRGVLLFAASIAAGFIVSWISGGTGTLPVGDFRSLVLTGWGGAAIVVGGYLLGFGTFSLLAETIVDFGYWELVAKGAKIIEVESLASVRAIDEDKALLGEGLADALNVGSF